MQEVVFQRISWSNIMKHKSQIIFIICQVVGRQLFFYILSILEQEEICYYKMLPFRQKMFRQKPYTNCFQCIQGQRLKCKKCMSNIIQNILQKKKSIQTLSIKNKIFSKIAEGNQQHFTSDSFNKTYNFSQLRNSTLSINTNYGFWLEKIKSKRNKTLDPLQQAISKWPHRKSTRNNKIKKLQGAKFQNWQKRFIKRLQDNTENPMMKKNKSLAKLCR